jgi:hypothetical protein
MGADLPSPAVGFKRRSGVSAPGCCAQHACFGNSVKGRSVPKGRKKWLFGTVKNKSTAPARLSFTSRGDVTIGFRGTNRHLDFARGRRDGLFFALDEDLHFGGSVATLQTIRNRQRSFDLTKRSSRE